LMESRPLFDRVPDQRLIADEQGSSDHIQATRGKDYIFVYSSQGEKITANTSTITGKEISTYWYNPRNGEVTMLGKSPKKLQQEFTPPTSGYGQDWVLVIDDASKKFKLPGK
jgi:Putative collagen-binding domain of a collagenase